MAMDYEAMYDTASGLLEEFGTEIVLKHDTGTYIIDSTTGKKTKVYNEYPGVGVKLGYSTEAIGNSNNIIQAGDVKIICQFSIEPIEDNDNVVMGNIVFNIIESSKVEPDASTTIIYILHCRKASK